MDHITVRKTFLDYFVEKGHRLVRSSPLVPAEDPTLLFTNAGMNQFEDLFLGREKRDYSRATSSQKCMRVSGKHNDFENVGHTPWHQTFFEMLGNFSFGDYFKAEAIGFAWELLTERYRLPVEKLWVTVFENDDEAARLWTSEVGVPEERIVRLGAKENFWSMGETGPCGPCSEIHYDLGPGFGCGGEDCPGLAHDCGRWTEFYNLVFMQFVRTADGETHDLPRPSIDTGMGMERITALVQGVTSDYDTDLFRPLLARLSEITGKEYGAGEEDDISLRICADHLRAAVFLVADSVVPSNEGRGYVLRKVLRRALQHGRRLGMEGPFLHQAVGSVVDNMGEVYPEVASARSLAEKTLEQEERSFGRVLDNGDTECERIVARLEERGEREVSGREAFRLHDTFGYPRDRLEEMAGERGLHVEWDEFEAEMEAQRHQSREASSIGQAEGGLEQELGDVPPTVFTGHVRPEGEWIREEGCRILALFDADGAPVDRLRGEGTAVLDRTPFYPDSGGQVGDTGALDDPDGGRTLAQATDTTYSGPPARRHFLHRVTTSGDAELVVGAEVAARIPAAERWATMRNHTATHLIHRALKDVLGDHVRQAGSVVDPQRLRFDFNHFEAPGPEDLARIEDLVNAAILANETVEWRVFSIEEARNMGAQMLFGEKYGEEVRVVSVGGFTDHDVSREFCGGTHCSATGEIGLVRITQERGIAAGVRRIEAVSGENAVRMLRRRDELLRSLEQDLNVPGEEVPARVQGLRDSVRQLEKETESLRLRLATGGGAAEGGEARQVGDLKVETRVVPDMDLRGLRDLADGLRQKARADVLGVGSVKDGKVGLVVSVDRSAAGGLDAVKLLRTIASVVGGGGGGRPDMAWGGGQDPGRLEEALAALFGVVEEAAGGPS